MLASSKIIVFSFGFVIGFFLYWLLHSNENNDFLENQENELYDKFIDPYTLEYESWLKNKKLAIEKANLDDLSYGKNRSQLRKSLESQLLFDLVHVTCVVFVTKQSNAYLIDSTWGHKCNTISFYSTVNDDYIKTQVIPFSNKWQFLCDTLRHLWISSEKLEWVIFSPDDVYVIPENLRYFVATKDFNKPYYFGHNVVFWQQIYNSDKTSYVLSYGAIKALMNRFSSSSACEKFKGVNDAVYNLGKHLSELGIHAADSRDFKKRNRFHIFTLNQLVAVGSPEVITRNSKTSLYPVTQGKSCCSDTSISFRTRLTDEVHFINYVLYKLKVFHSGWAANRPKDEKDTDEVWKTVLKDFFKINGNYSDISAEKYNQLWREFILTPEAFNEKLRKEFQKEQ